MLDGNRRPRRHRRARALRQDRQVHLRPGLHVHGELPLAASPTSTATRASCSTAAIPIEQLAETLQLPRSRLPDPERRAAEQEAARRVREHRDASHHGARAADRASIPASAATRTRWRCMCGVVGALSAFYHDSINIYDARSREISAFRLIAKLPTITAMTYKYNMGQPFMYPKNSLSYVENFLYMMFGTPCEEYKPNPVLSRAMDRILILHADHEQNASTSTVRLAGSTGANPFACISAGIASLWGPAHGGANEAVLKMLDEHRRREEHPGLHQAREGEGRPLGAVRLRPPRLQELRSAREDHPADLPRGAGRARSQGRQALQARAGAGEDRARGRVLHQAQALSRTSISIPASSTRRSASRWRCSPRFSRSRARWAGSRSGTS